MSTFTTPAGQQLDATDPNPFLVAFAANYADVGAGNLGRLAGGWLDAFDVFDAGRVSGTAEFDALRTVVDALRTLPDGERGTSAQHVAFAVEARVFLAHVVVHRVWPADTSPTTEQGRFMDFAARWAAIHKEGEENSWLQGTYDGPELLPPAERDEAIAWAEERARAFDARLASITRRMWADPEAPADRA